MAINVFNESKLHRSLKNFYTEEQSKQEVSLEGSVCDIFHQDGSITEIQTAGLSALRAKLEKFLPTRRVTVVYPIALTRYIRMLNADGSPRSYRKSPKHGSYFQLFRELTGIYHLLDHPNLYFCIVYIDAEISKIDDKKSRSRFKNPRSIEKALLLLHSDETRHGLAELFEPILSQLPKQFGTEDLKAIGCAKHTTFIVWMLKKTNYLPYKREGRKLVFLKK